MNEKPFVKRLHYKDRWFCYLDLLGFKNLVQSGKLDEVVPLYHEVLSKLDVTLARKRGQGIQYSWFSDTFIIFSKTATPEEFALVEQAGRLFFQSLILAKIPVRGALTFGPLYSQLERNIFIGEALIDAYLYGEKQKWLGFILTPKVYDRLQESTIPVPKRMNYRRVEKPGILSHEPTKNVYAFAFANGTVNGRNPYVDAIKTMMQGVSDPDVLLKYQNTLDHIEESKIVQRAHEASACD